MLTVTILLYADWDVLSNKYGTSARQVSIQNESRNDCACYLAIKVKTDIHMQKYKIISIAKMQIFMLNINIKIIYFNC